MENIIRRTVMSRVNRFHATLMLLFMPYSLTLQFKITFTECKRDTQFSMSDIRAGSAVRKIGRYMHTHSDQFNRMAFPTMYQSRLGLLFMRLFGQSKQNKDFMNILSHYILNGKNNILTSIWKSKSDKFRAYSNTYSYFK